MKKHELQDLQISASLVVETVLISMKTGNWLVAYVYGISELISIYLQSQRNVYGNNNVHLNWRKCKNVRSPQLQNFQSPSCSFEVSSALLKVQRECDCTSEFG